MAYEETPDGIRRIVKRKRPGTLGVCALIQHKYKIDAVPHILCLGFSREETEDFMIELRYLGIDNVLAVRGDEGSYQKPLLNGRSANPYAIQLVEQIHGLNQGAYLEENLLDAEPSDFCIGIAGYPEKHFEAPNLVTDVRHTKEKVDAGADYIVTQMFFDNADYFRFVDECRAQGITVPIIPGLKILNAKSQLRSIPRTFHADIPSELADAVETAGPGQTLEIGAEWTAKQVEGLLEGGVPAVHFYIMQSAKPVKMVLERLGL